MPLASMESVRTQHLIGPPAHWMSLGAGRAWQTFESPRETRDFELQELQAYNQIATRDTPQPSDSRHTVILVPVIHWGYFDRPGQRIRPRQCVPAAPSIESRHRMQ